MSALFAHTSCHGTFISQDRANADALHIRHKALFDSVAKYLELPFTHITVSEVQPNALDAAIAQIKTDTAQERRSVLLVGGAYLDEFVSLVSLEALAEGYDVHLLVDLSMSLIPQLTRVSEYRLFQAGAVPVSLRQLLLQWRAVASDPRLDATLSELIDNYDHTALQKVADDDFKLIQNHNRKGKLPWQAI